jgi:hypothetical protein
MLYYTGILMKFQKSCSSKARRESWGKWCQIIFSFRCLLLLTLLCFKHCLFTLQEPVKLIFINECETSFDIDIAAANYSCHGRSTLTDAQFLLSIWYRSPPLRPLQCVMSAYRNYNAPNRNKQDFEARPCEGRFS